MNEVKKNKKRSVKKQKKGHIISVDGTVGSGKSTASRQLAMRLGYAYLDTGAMYRTIGWKAHTTGTGLNEDDLAKLCGSTRIEVELSDDRQRIIVDGQDITAEIRTPEISRMASAVSTFASVRNYLVNLQKDMGSDLAEKYGGVIVEGRDIGTVVFPDAAVKFYLDATVMERAKRRCLELRKKGIDLDMYEIVIDIQDRDESDKERDISPLKLAEDAVAIDTTSMSLEEVVDEMLSKIKGIS